MAIPVIAVMRKTYLGRSETWIHAELRRQRRVRKIVLTTRVENRDRFPWPAVYMPADLRRWTRPWWRDRLSRRLLRHERYFEEVVRRERVALLHPHFGYDALWALPLQERTGLPLVATFHGGDLYEEETLRVVRPRYPRLFATGAAFIVLGANMRRAILELGCPPAKARVIHLCVDLDEWPFAERPPLSDGLDLLFCARLIEVKGLRYVLDALRILKDRGVRARLRVIGYVGANDVPEMDHAAYVKQLGIEDRATFLGYQPPERFREELRRAHVFLQPSVRTVAGQIEGGHPTTLVEAQAAGCPVIGTFHSDIPEVVRDGQTGLLVHERQPEGIADRLAWFAANPEALAAFGRAARAHIEANYNGAVENEKLESLYLDLIARR